VRLGGTTSRPVRDLARVVPITRADREHLFTVAGLALPAQTVSLPADRATADEFRQMHHAHPGAPAD